MVTSAADLNKGEHYEGKIDRISGNGNGIIELNDSHINIGKTSESKVGKWVVFRYEGGYRGSTDDQTPAAAETVTATEENPIADSAVSNSNNLLNNYSNDA